MTNKIEVDTSKLEDYVWTLQNIVSSIGNIDSRLSWHANFKGYKNLQSFLWQYSSGSPLSCYHYNLIANKDYLQSIIDHVTYVESLLQQIDPLNFSGTYEKAVVSTSSIRKGIGGIAEDLNSINKVAGIFNDSLGKNTDEIYESLKKLGDSTDGLADTVKSVGKGMQVAGVVYNAAQNFTENLDPTRAVAETVVETVVDTAIDTAVTAAIGAVATLVLGAVSFPVSLAIGGLAVLTTTVADYAVKQVTDDGDGLVETVSDWILDDVVADWFNW